jgi:hypothetical protein
MPCNLAGMYCHISQDHHLNVNHCQNLISLLWQHHLTFIPRNCNTGNISFQICYTNLIYIKIIHYRSFFFWKINTRNDVDTDVCNGMEQTVLQFCYLHFFSKKLWLRLTKLFLTKILDYSLFSWIVPNHILFKHIISQSCMLQCNGCCSLSC